MESAGMLQTLKNTLRLDSIMNVFTGLGDALHDRTKSNIFEPNRRLGDGEMSALYNDEPIGRLICELPGFDALRKGFTVVVKDDNEGEDIGAQVKDYLTRLEVVSALAMGNDFDRAFGGAGVWVGLDDGATAASEPVNVNNVKSVLFLRVLDRRRLRPWKIDDDTRSPTYNKPILWAVMPEEVFAADPESAKGLQPVELVHASRLIIFPGRNVSDDRKARNGGWGDSIFQACLNSLEHNATAWQTLAVLVTKASQGVIKVKDLAVMATSSDQGAVEARFRLLKMGRSVVRDLVIDAEESYEQTAPNFGNLPDVLYLCMFEVASAVQIPVTRLFGMSPAGMNATGESDARNWEDVVEALQTLRLEPRLRQLIDLVFLAKDGPTGGVPAESYEIAWEPLRQMTAAEQATLRKTVAETDAIYIDKEVLSPEEVAINRFRADGWSAETAVDLEVRQALLEAAAAEAAKSSLSGIDTDPTAALNGAQVEGLLELVGSVARRELPRESGIAAMLVAFPITPAQAELVMGEVGRSFFAAPKAPESEPSAPPAPESEPGTPPVPPVPPEKEPA